MPRTRVLSDHAVLERAIDVFWGRGYAGTSLRDLTQATGLSASALYHRFGDKDGLFVEALRRYADEGLVGRLARLSAAEDPVDAIARFLDDIVTMSVDDPQHRGCLLVNTALDGAPMSDAARALVRTRLGEVEAFFARRLQSAAERGLLAFDIDAASHATALLGAVFAIRVTARLDPDPRRLRVLARHAMAALPRAPAVDGRARAQ